MMQTIEDVRKWIGHMNGLFTLMQEVQEATAELSVRVEHARTMNHKKAETKWLTELAYSENQLELCERDVLAATGRPDLASAFELVTDVRVRTQEAMELYEVWRRALAGKERLELGGAFAEGSKSEFTLEDCDTVCAAAEQTYKLQLALATRLIPAAV